MSKGSGRRPQQAQDDKVAESWERIFGKKDCSYCQRNPCSYQIARPCIENGKRDFVHACSQQNKAPL